MRKALSFSALALTTALVFSACGGDDDDSDASQSTPDTEATTDDTDTSSDTSTDDAEAVALTASDLRSTLEFTLQEHVYLAGLATGQALAGNTAGFEGAAAALDANSDDLVGAVTTVYGEEAGAAFDPLWRKHIGFFVAYTQAIAADDQAGADAAVADLTAYADEFGAFLESATEGGLPKEAVAELLGEHAGTLIAAIDAQKAGNAMEAFANLKDAAGHMPMIGDALAAAIATQQGLS